MFDNHDIDAHVKMGKQGLAMEGMLAMIMDTLRCGDTQTILSIITTLNGDQATLWKLKEDCEAEKKLIVEMYVKVKKLEENKTRLLRHNNKLDLSFKNKENQLNR